MKWSGGEPDKEGFVTGSGKYDDVTGIARTGLLFPQISRHSLSFASSQLFRKFGWEGKSSTLTRGETLVYTAKVMEASRSSQEVVDEFRGLDCPCMTNYCNSIITTREIWKACTFSFGKHCKTQSPCIF